MKKKFLIILATGLLIFGVVGMANATFIETVDVYQYSVGGNITWNHTYDFSETPPLTAMLTIVADDVDADDPATTNPNGDDGENDLVYLNGTLLGELTQLPTYSNFNYHPGPGNPNQPLTTSVFSFDPSLLDWTIPISVSVEALWGVEIETSTLTVAPVPEPTTMLLLGTGLVGVAGAARRKKKNQA